jgi:glucose-1-phosphate cytidylyltransferase
MKVVIFAGGIGTRISEESHLRPKPMIEIGDKPMLWHIMKIYESQGFNEFIICLGHKGYMIKEYFLNYFMHSSDITVDLKTGKTEVHATDSNTFKVTLVETGLETRTAGRLKRVQKYIGNEEFMLTYGDGVADINMKDLIDCHHKSGKIATMTVIQPDGKFGSLEFDHNGTITNFKEKPKGDRYWINGGFFVLKPEVFNYLDDNADHLMWEEKPLEKLAEDRQLNAFRHQGFWKCMDAIRDKVILEEIWKSDHIPWKLW